MENPTHTFREMNLELSSYKTCELKVKLLWVAAREREKSALFVTFILTEENFFDICVLSWSIVYWINF